MKLLPPSYETLPSFGVLGASLSWFPAQLLTVLPPLLVPPHLPGSSNGIAPAFCLSSQLSQPYPYSGAQETSHVLKFHVYVNVSLFTFLPFLFSSFLTISS